MENEANGPQGDDNLNYSPDKKLVIESNRDLENVLPPQSTISVISSKKTPKRNIGASPHHKTTAGKPTVSQSMDYMSRKQAAGKETSH